MALHVNWEAIVEADITPPEGWVFMLMLREMDDRGDVYGVVDGVAHSTYYRAIRKLREAGLVVKPGRYASAWRIPSKVAWREGKSGFRVKPKPGVCGAGIDGSVGSAGLVPDPIADKRVRGWGRGQRRAAGAGDGGAGEAVWEECEGVAGGGEAAG